MTELAIFARKDQNNASIGNSNSAQMINQISNNPQMKQEKEENLITQTLYEGFMIDPYCIL